MRTATSHRAIRTIQLQEINFSDNNLFTSTRVIKIHFNEMISCTFGYMCIVQIEAKICD